MKQAMLECVVTGIKGTEFADGQKVVKVSLEDFTSFNMQPEDPILKKINVGAQFDLTYTFDKTNDANTRSGAAVTYHNLIGAKIIVSTIKQAEADPALASLNDVTDPNNIVYTKVGEGTGTATGTGAPQRV